MNHVSRVVMTTLLVAVPVALVSCTTGANIAGPCPAIAGVIASGTLVSPAPGATGVPTSIGRVTFTVSSADLQGPESVVTFAGKPPGNATGGNTFVMNAGTVSTTNGVSSVGPLPMLQPGLTYTVSAQAAPLLPNSNCRGSVEAVIGSFST